MLRVVKLIFHSGVNFTIIIIITIVVITTIIIIIIISIIIIIFIIRSSSSNSKSILNTNIRIYSNDLQSNILTFFSSLLFLFFINIPVFIFFLQNILDSF